MLNRKLKIIAGYSFSLLFSLPAGSHQLNEAVDIFNDSTVIATDKTVTAKASVSATAIRLNKQAALFTKDYIRRNTAHLDLMKVRGEKHFPMMDSIFTVYELPVELKYLAVIESELKSSATSKVGAKGPWQFMPQTAKCLGLKITRHYDERTSYKKSTRAAAIYLKDLHRQFGDWLLVLAAYNSGPGPVYSAIKKTGSRNFWKLQHHLPAESRGHVKKFIATHFYFEGQGGLTTMTQYELKAMLAAR